MTKEKKTEKTEQPEVVVPKVKGMVAHCDGSANPNPGPAGWGLHGYIYEDVEPTKGTGNPDYVLTAQDYYTKADKLNLPDVPVVTPLHYIDGYGSFPYKPGLVEYTNNYAELTGATRALQLALKEGVERIALWSDSEYVVKGMEWSKGWKANGWKKKDGNPPASLELWKEFDAALMAVKEAKIKVTFKWVRGHNGNLGNELADELAYIGMRHAANGQVLEKIELKEAQGYWKYDNNRHPMLALRRMYFNSDSQFNVAGEYCMGEDGSEEERRGIRAADTAFAVVRLKEPDAGLEMLRNYTSYLADNRNAVMVARVDYYFRAAVHSMLSQWGSVPLRRRNRSLDIILADDKEPIATEMEPPHKVQDAVNSISELNQTLNEFLNHSADLVTTDLTPLIYETVVEKKKSGEVSINKLKPEFAGHPNQMTVATNFRRPDGTLDVVDVKLSLGLDVLDRNSLKRLEELAPTITLVTWQDGEQAFRYATVVQSGEDIGIWASVHSNMRIILPKAA